MTHVNTAARIGLLAGLVSATLALATPAFAADSDALPQAAMSLRGIDFTSPRSVAHLKRHLSSIAAEICTPGGHVLPSRDERACYETAITDGLTQIDSRTQQAMRDRAVRLADAPGDASQKN